MESKFDFRIDLKPSSNSQKALKCSPKYFLALKSLQILTRGYSDPDPDEEGQEFK